MRVSNTECYTATPTSGFGHADIPNNPSDTNVPRKKQGHFNIKSHYLRNVNRVTSNIRQLKFVKC